MVASNCKEMGADSPSCPFQSSAPVMIHKHQSEKQASDRKGLINLSKA